KGMPFFVNPYYLSLVAVDDNQIPSGIDQTIRDYMIYSDELIDEFGEIVAWEKEDQVEPGKPNAAGWILPTRHSMHRRYPNVAILIPDTMGRACGGLCSTCQRMYDFQRGHLDFDYDKKKPQESWPDKLNRLMNYFKEDSQLRDILITGGDALMSSNQSLQQILDAVYKMARKKKEENKERPQGKKYAEMVRVRLGTRLPVYLPQRIDDEMIEILQDFKEKARKVGIKQFIIQTHIESPLEITDRTREAVQKFLKAGWIVTNQLVFTAAASRRGHTAQLRKILNDIGVLTYYTFSCKGFMENHHHFVPHARAVQEQLEEKIYGVVSKDSQEQLNDFTENVPDLKKKIDELREEADVDFLSTDRNMLNLPAVGKSLTFRTIGLTWDGRRILEFDHDPNRAHSPIIEKMGKVVIIESKSISDYLKQLQEMGEDVEDYKGVYGYSMGATEQRAPIYRYPEYDFETTDRISNLEV
ncbi:MAG TPA: KamA family protein, partial [bacterium]|nr:KamA family protein [bacterium]